MFLVFSLKLLAMLVLVRNEHEENQAHIFQDACFKISQIHQLTIMYCSEHANHECFSIIHIFIRVNAFSQQ